MLVLVLFNVVIIAELVSVYFGGGLIDYQFYVNLNPADIVIGLWIFKFQALLCLLCFVIVLFICYALTGLLARFIPKALIVALFVVSVTAISGKDAPASKLYEVYQITQAEPTDFSLALKNVAIKPSDYPNKQDLVASPGKNIIVISLESVERGFLTPPFNQLTPNLNQLTKEFNFYADMPMSTGSSWTLASLYTYMTGVPLLLGGYNTHLFEDKTASRLVSLGDVLNKAGYRTQYIIGNPQFAGMGKAIDLFGIEVISENTYPGRYPIAPFGLYDRDLFDLAQYQIEGLREQSSPFALFISTVSTHAPSGFYDSRMESLVAKQSSNLEFTVASLDYNLGQFMTYLKQAGLMENTVIYIFPDHQMMGYGTDVIAKLSQKPRGLYLITNADTVSLGKSTADTVFQIDLPRIIVDGAHVKSNAKFLTDFLTDRNKSEYINQNKEQLATLNSSSFSNY
jgi:phosphoglycerol transferase MdoB-like AlkP superfamily enzyme